MTATRIADIISQMDMGLDRAVLRCLEKREGAILSIQKDEMIGMLHQIGYGNKLKYSTFERQVRQCVTDLRKRGYLICSSSGDTGYYLAANRAEYDEFVTREYEGRIKDMQETVAAMDNEAKVRWGTGLQMGLF